MTALTYTAPIQQLEPRRGAYFYVRLTKAQFQQLNSKRLICRLDDRISYGCGVNHMGDGDYFIIIAKAKLKQLDKALGEVVEVALEADPNPLGVAEPEVLLVLLEQDDWAKAAYGRLTDGKKRGLIYQVLKIKDIDRQVEHILAYLHEHGAPKRS